MGVFPHTERFLDEDRQKEQWRVAEKLLKNLQADIASGGPPTGPAGGDLSGTYPNPSIATSAVTSGKIADGTIVDADLNASAAIDATKIANGTVNNTEFQYINSLTSNAQTQLDAKAPTASPTFTGQSAFPAGSAGSPSIIPTGDTNTGVCFPAADQVVISTGGTARLTLTTSLITASVSVLLSTTSRVYFRGTGSTGTSIYSNGSSTMAFLAGTTGVVQLDTTSFTHSAGVAVYYDGVPVVEYPQNETSVPGAIAATDPFLIVCDPSMPDPTGNPWDLPGDTGGALSWEKRVFINRSAFAVDIQVNGGAGTIDGGATYTLAIGKTVVLRLDDTFSDAYFSEVY